MCLSMQFLFPTLVIVVLFHCMFKNFNDSKLLPIFVSKILSAVLYHCMFKYVLFYLPDETLKHGQNASR